MGKAQIQLAITVIVAMIVYDKLVKPQVDQLF